MEMRRAAPTREKLRDHLATGEHHVRRSVPPCKGREKDERGMNPAQLKSASSSQHQVVDAASWQIHRPTGLDLKCIEI
jgi:hypothetical protein